MATIPVKISDCILLSNAKKRLIIDFRTTCEVKLAQHISQKKKKKANQPTMTAGTVM